MSVSVSIRASKPPLRGERAATTRVASTSRLLQPPFSPDFYNKIGTPLSCGSDWGSRPRTVLHLP